MAAELLRRTPLGRPAYAPLPPRPTPICPAWRFSLPTAAVMPLLARVWLSGGAGRRFCDVIQCDSPSRPLPLPSWHVTTSNAVGAVEQSGRHALCLARVCQTSGGGGGGGEEEAICRVRAGRMKTPPPSATLTLIQPHPPTSCQTLQWVASSGGP